MPTPILEFASGGAVDYAASAGSATIPIGTVDVAWTGIKGNINNNGTLFTLLAGKVYRLQASLSLNFNIGLAVSATYQFVDAANVAIGANVAMIFNQVAAVTGDSIMPNTSTIFTPSVNTQVKVRILSSGAATGATIVRANMSIQQLGSTAIIPPAKIEPVSVRSSPSNMLINNEFIALTTSAGNWTAGEILVQIQVADSTTGVINSTIWLKLDGTTVAVSPIIGTDVEDATKTFLSLLTSIEAKSTTTPSTQLWAAGTATASSVGAALAQVQGLSQAVEINVTAIAAGTTVVGEIQEAGVSGTVWRTAYRFEPIVATGYYRSALLPTTTGQWRYVETITGATPSVTRVVNAVQTSLPAQDVGIPKRAGRFNLVNAGFDLLLAGRTRRIVVTNRTNNVYFLQVHNSAVALTTGLVPSHGETHIVAQGSTLHISAAELGEHGTILGTNPRLGLSTTLATYTPISSVAVNTIGLFVESL